MTLEKAEAFIYDGYFLRIVERLPKSNPMDIVTTTAPHKDINFQRFSYKFLKENGARPVSWEEHPEEFL